MRLLLFTSPRSPQESAEQPRISEQIRMAQRRDCGMEAAHAQAGHRPVPFICQHMVMRFDIRNQVPHQHFREKLQVPLPGTVPDHAVPHHDDHCFHNAFCQQPVGNPAHMPLINPAYFILPVSMLQIKDRICFLRVILRRRINQADLMLPGHGRRIIAPGHRAVFHTVQIVPAFHILHGNIHKVHRPAASVADRQIRTKHICPVDFQEKIQKSLAEIKGAFPGAVSHRLQRMNVFKLVDNNFLRIFCNNPEMYPPVRQHLGSLFSVPVRFSVIRVKRKRNIQRPLLFHFSAPPLIL